MGQISESIFLKLLDDDKIDSSLTDASDDRCFRRLSYKQWLPQHKKQYY